MKTFLIYFATLSAIALLPVLTPSAANAQESSSKLSVTSKEFRYDKPYDALAIKSATKPSSQHDTEHSSSVSDESEEVHDAFDKTAREHKYMGVSKSANSITVNSVNEYWIYETWVTLHSDLDADGYHSTFSVEFDADTIFTSAPVYAVLYLGRNGTYDAIHVSSEFYIYGEDSTDTFTIESTLVSGFPSDDYDILLELYDADSETLVTFTDGYDDAALAYVPLESENNEYVIEDRVIIVEEHGGTWSLLSLIFICGVVVIRRILNR
ncbi:hypothetical protein D210916BOD24_25380 [Alteromonas sp. D210916BOD_24]|uniref:choice-of-anchor H family protein n=1 Tax=Alteromonas sp. D210916BOD_24 TaxID=3157618 RepID=UPI00399C83C2